MRLKLLPLLFLSFLLNSCAHGPQVTVWTSDPANSNGFVDSKKEVLPYSQAVGYSIYPPDSIQMLLNYCAARNETGTQPPQFAMCSLDSSGFDCVEMACSLNAAQNGIACSKAGSVFFTPFDLSDKYVAFSKTDQITLMAYCNVVIPH